MVKISGLNQFWFYLKLGRSQHIFHPKGSTLGWRVNYTVPKGDTLYSMHKTRQMDRQSDPYWPNVLLGLISNTVYASIKLLSLSEDNVFLA